MQHNEPDQNTPESSSSEEKSEHCEKDMAKQIAQYLDEGIQKHPNGQASFLKDYGKLLFTLILMGGMAFYMYNNNYTPNEVSAKKEGRTAGQNNAGPKNVEEITHEINSLRREIDKLRKRIEQLEKRGKTKTKTKTKSSRRLIHKSTFGEKEEFTQEIYQTTNTKGRHNGN